MTTFQFACPKCGHTNRAEFPYISHPVEDFTEEIDNITCTECDTELSVILHITIEEVP